MLDSGYKPELPLVLKGLTFSTDAGERLGALANDRSLWYQRIGDSTTMFSPYGGFQLANQATPSYGWFMANGKSITWMMTGAIPMTLDLPKGFPVTRRWPSCIKLLAPVTRHFAQRQRRRWSHGCREVLFAAGVAANR